MEKSAAYTWTFTVNGFHAERMEKEFSTVALTCLEGGGFDPL